jgi:hypothetical protein
VIGLALATAALWTGKISGENWVYVLVIVISGHHAEDLIKAYRRQ